MASAVLGKVSPTPKGEYVSTQDYDRLDVVTYEGYPYLAKSNVPSGNLPTDELYWMPLLTDLDFAPGGYGLGTTGTYCANANNANKSGWYGVDTNTTNIPSGAPGTMFVKTLSTENGTDIYQTVTSGVTAIRRYYSSWAGAWQPWEYENPPMSLGVEYRTTERCEGNPVYAKRISYTPNGTLGNENVMTDITIPHGISGFGKLVRSNGTVSTYQFPVVMANGGTLSISQVSVSAIVVRLYKCTAASTMYFDLYYTK